MRQFRLDYSLKNIPIPSRDNYLRNLIEKAESVLKRMRWKAHFFLKGEKSQENTRNFGLSSNKTPPTVLELKPFEEDVIKLLETIKFRDKKDYFQDTLANDLRATVCKNQTKSEICGKVQIFYCALILDLS